MWRKGLAVVIAMVALALMVPPALAAESPFVDVPEGHWAYEAIANLAAAGLVQGYPDGTFGGSRMLTRYEAAMVFSRMLTRLENVIRQDVAGEFQGLSAQVAADVTQRVMARVTQMLEEKLAQSPTTVERVVVERQPQVTERVVVEQSLEMNDEVRNAIAAIVAEELQQQLGLDVDLAAVRGDLDAIRSVLNRRVEQLMADIEALRSTQEGLGQSLSAVNDLAVESVQRIGALEAQVISLSGQAATQDEIDALSVRVQRLEQSNRRLTWAAVLLGIAAVAGIVIN